MSIYDPRDRNLSRTRLFIQRLFPERQVMIRSGGNLRTARLSLASQIALTVAGCAIVGWTVVASVGMVGGQVRISQQDAELAEARTAYEALVAQVTVYRSKISDVTADLEKNHARAVQLARSELSPDTATKADALDRSPARKSVVVEARESIGTVQALDPALSRELFQNHAQREREALYGELARLDTEMAELAQRAAMEKALDGVEVQLKKVTLERDLAAADSSQAKDRIRQLEDKLVGMEEQQLALVQKFTNLANDRAAKLRTAVSKAGLNAQDLLEDMSDEPGEKDGQGGPFIPAELGVSSSPVVQETLGVLNSRIEHMTSLQALVEMLPLAAPLEEKWRVTSSFGYRKDPVNGASAVHEGLDMAAEYKSPVYATGSGKVIYAGWRGRYGRLVEIDHGNGIKTRFGHLNKVLVKKGEQVDRTSLVGLLGNSGRSTGAHLHYEVIVNGNPRNPDRFIKAGSNVFESE